MYVEELQKSPKPRSFILTIASGMSAHKKGRFGEFFRFGVEIMKLTPESSWK
jgi:hypothetical protein